MIRNWFILGISFATLLLGGGLLGAPVAIGNWMHDIAEKETQKQVAPILVELRAINETLRDVKQLMKESRDREIQRGATSRPN